MEIIYNGFSKRISGFIKVKPALTIITSEHINVKTIESKYQFWRVR